MASPKSNFINPQTLILLIDVSHSLLVSQDDRTMRELISDFHKEIIVAYNSEEGWAKRYSSSFAKVLELKQKHLCFEWFYHKENRFKDRDRHPLIIHSDGKKFREAITILTDRYNTETSSQLGIEDFILHIDSLFAENSQPTTKMQKLASPSSADSDIFDTLWYFYYHEYNPSSLCLCSTISRFVLYIDSEGQGKMFGSNDVNDFEIVEPVVYSKNVISLDLKNNYIDKKDLHLRVYVPSRITSKSVFLGQYIDYEVGDFIVSGTFILENAHGKTIESPIEVSKLRSKNQEIREVSVPLSLKHGNRTLYSLQIELSHKTDWKKFIPTPIAKYLQDKWKNFTKSAKGIYDFNSLETFFKKQKDKSFAQKKYSTIINYDLFIIMPGGSMEEGEKQRLRKEISNTFFKIPDVEHEIEKTMPEDETIYEANDTLKRMGIQKIYFSPRVFNCHYKDNHWESEPKKILENDLQKLRESRMALLIMPDSLSSSALVKVGAAIELGRLTFIFPLKLNVLPKVLTENFHHLLIVNKLSESKKHFTIKDIPNVLMKNHKELLLEH